MEQFPIRGKMHDPVVPVSVTHIKRPVGGKRYVCGHIEVSGILPCRALLPKGCQQIPCRVKFQHLVQAHISNPDVSHRIECQAVRHHKGVTSPLVKHFPSISI